MPYILLTVACISLCIRCARATWTNFTAKHVSLNQHLTSHCRHASRHVTQREDSSGRPAQRMHWPGVSAWPSDGRRRRSEM